MFDIYILERSAFLCQILGSYGGFCEDSGVLGCGAFRNYLPVDTAEGSRRLDTS